jgi:hypothetical protein
MADTAAADRVHPAACVWVQLVSIDGEQVDYTLKVKTDGILNIHFLKEAIAEVVYKHFDAEIHSLDVYPAGTTAVAIASAEQKPLRPSTQRSDFPETTYETPLLVTAKRRRSRHLPPHSHSLQPPKATTVS